MDINARQVISRASEALGMASTVMTFVPIGGPMAATIAEGIRFAANLLEFGEDVLLDGAADYMAALDGINADMRAIQDAGGATEEDFEVRRNQMREHLARARAAVEARRAT